MFVDNGRKIIVLSVPGTDPDIAELFFREQLQAKLIDGITFLDLKIIPDGDPRVGIRRKGVNLDLPNIIPDLTTTTRTNRRTGRSYHQIPDLIEKGLLLHSLDSYEIYGICINPIDRVIGEQEEMIFLSANRTYINSIIENREIPGYVPNRYPLSADSIRTQLLLGLEKNYMDPTAEGYDISEARTPDHIRPQSLWLKYLGQPINHIFKYDNYVGFISAICALYDIDPTLYNDMERISSRKTNLIASDLTVELQNKISEIYAEDKALYDSL